MVHVGDEIEILMNKAGRPKRHGTVQKVIEEDPLRVQVRWDDGHSSILMPSAGNLQVMKEGSE